MSEVYRVGRVRSPVVRTIAALIALSAVTAACSSASDRIYGSSSPSTPSNDSSPSFGDSFKQLFSGSSATTASASTPAPDPGADQINCPQTDIRQGASTLSLAGTGSDPAATTLRYQGTFGQIARECAIQAGMLTIKVGVQGRIILGPEGKPGPVDVPLRYALVQEGPSPKTIWTKFYKTTVVIPEGQTGAPFTHIQNDISLPKPKAADLDSYVIYVGFDPLSLKSEAPKKKAPAPRKR
jgi:hypothetical protein